LPAKTGLAVVILQHLPPSQTGKLARALASATSLPVVDAVNGHRVQPNTIVVVPPRTSASLVRGALVLRVPKGGERPKQPIDGLFSSLAAALGMRAIGVVLSGTADDGTMGLREIREAGGVTLVQEPATAQFDDMPRNAIAAGAADVVLAPQEIGLRLATLAAETASGSPPRGKLDPISRVLELLRNASGIDFTSYKRSTIERRLTLSMSRARVSSLASYAKFLASHPAELRALYEDLLIHVTEFFRDGDELDAACTRLAELVTRTPRETPVRVWVPGCSTGQEVYTLAMLLVEKLGDGQPLQVFGTDLSERAIEIARRGRYAAASTSQITPERLARFFEKEDGTYRVRRELRERCVFVRHDLVTDPPFSKLDLVSCRNVLIYLGPDLQRRVISVFHYALNQPGLLLLGRAESVTGFESFFSSVDADARVFLRKARPAASLSFLSAGQLGRIPVKRPDDPMRSKLGVQRDVDQLLLARYVPACVIIDDHMDVVQFRGRTGAYLEQPSGQPQLNVVRMAREELAGELRMAIQRAQRSGLTARKAGIRLRDRGRVRHVDLEVVPVPATEDQGRHFAVVFEERAPERAEPVARARGKKPSDEDLELSRLHQELEASREYVRSVTAQHLAASEDLSILNEELQSTNEELQSTNEELQTSKEELQSTNEELETVNEELQRSNAALRLSNDDLLNVLASIDIAIIIVDTDRVIRRFTPKARAVLKLIPGDVGRPIADLKPTIPADELDAAISSVIDTLAPHESEVRTLSGTSYRLQIRPYRTDDDRIDGAVISFIDVSELKDRAQAAVDFAESVVQTVPSPLVLLDAELRIRSGNPAFSSAVAGGSPTQGRGLLELGGWQATNLGERLRGVFASGRPIAGIEVEHRAPAREPRLYQLGAAPISSGQQRLLLVGLADITARRRLEELAVAAEKQRDSFVAAVSDELRTPLSAILLWVDVLRELERSDPQHAEAIETIAECARAEARLVDDLIDLALSASGDLPVDSIDLEPAAVVRAAVDSVRPTAEARQVTLATELAQGPHIHVDPRRLQQITSRLLANAIEFTPTGGTVRVALAPAGDTVEIRVSDTGRGIGVDFLPRAFEPFSQEDRSATRAHRGLGIGLALVRYLVARQAGTVDATSVEGQGTTITVRFPATSRA
jgi:two-component system CheB/CheR fusion protein